MSSKNTRRRLHYEFRLEVDEVLKSWAVTKGSSLDPHDKRLAVEVKDHPLDYGDFEGTIPKGQYAGGSVQLWDRGYWVPNGDPIPALRKNELKFAVQGERLHGEWVLVRIKSRRASDKKNNWLLIKHRDEFARDNDCGALLSADHSVASGRTMAEIAAGKARVPSHLFSSLDFAVLPIQSGTRTKAPPCGRTPSEQSGKATHRTHLIPNPCRTNPNFAFLPIRCPNSSYPSSVS